MVLSVTFSFVIYRIASTEIQTRLEHLQTSLQSQQNSISPGTLTEKLQSSEADGAAENISTGLIYANIFVFILGGFVSYYLARRSLIPIEKAHEAQSRFTSDASHELRTPLAVMKTELEVALRDENATVQDLKQVLSSSIEEVDKLTKLSEMLLSLSRMDNVKLKLSYVNLTKITRDTINTLGQTGSRIYLKSKKIQMVRANETAITDIIKILIDNALQYSPKDSQVRITISKQNENVVFEITNYGQGIDQDKLPHIFERFYRADSSRSSGKQKGYGLGLALAKNITELHNGSLKVTSEIDGDTVFTLILPSNFEKEV